MLFIAIYLLGSTADVYLSPVLEYLTLRFSIPESLAGVTLLAFGNGAPDVFSTIAAGGDNDDDSDNNDAIKPVCVLFGGTLFITSIVLSLSIRAAQGRQIALTPRYFIRDWIFFMIPCIYLLIVLLFVHKIDIYGSLIMMFIYFFYVGVVVIQSR
jgi:sodium/potassium/calcium exchanger 6